MIVQQLAQGFNGQVLLGQAATIVAVAGLTGVRKGELRGLLWENYDGQEIRITQSVWRSFVDEPKTQKSKAPVPVIGQLAVLLERYRAELGMPTRGLIFPNGVGKPINLDQLAYKIKPFLKKAGIEWHGWHAFRRGLATNLHRLGVKERHSSDPAAFELIDHDECLREVGECGRDSGDAGSECGLCNHYATSPKGKL